MAVIKQLKNFFTSENVYPKTVEKAIYDVDGNRLDNKLNAISRNGVLTSSNADYAEIGIWADGNPNSELRVGKFVTIDTAEGGATISIANSRSDIVGVTVASPAFAANASDNKFSNGRLLPEYAFVCLMGMAQIRDNGTCTVKGRCMPDDNGDAVPSSNDMGYQVISRIDDDSIIVAISPNGEMLQRIKTVITEISTKVDSMDITVEDILDAVGNMEGGGLLAIRDECREYSRVAENAAWINSRWQISEPKERVGNLYGLDKADPTVMDIPENKSFVISLLDN